MSQQSIQAALPVPSVESQAREGFWLMVTAGALLGTVGLFAERAGEHPMSIVWFRCVFGASTLLAWVMLRGGLATLRCAPGSTRMVLAAAACMNISWLLFFASIERVPIGIATLVFHLQPLWVLALGVLWLGETVTRRQSGAVVLATIGLVLGTGLVGDDGLPAAPMTDDYLAGLGLALLGSLVYAGSTLCARRARPTGSIAMAWWQCVVGALAFAWWPMVQGLPATPSAWGWLVAIGVLHTGLAYVLMYGGIARLTAGPIAALLFVYPATALVLDAIVYGHTLGVVQLLGVALMAVALWNVRVPSSRRACPASQR